MLAVASALHREIFPGIQAVNLLMVDLALRKGAETAATKLATL